MLIRLPWKPAWRRNSDAYIKAMEAVMPPPPVKKPPPEPLDGRGENFSVSAPVSREGFMANGRRADHESNTKIKLSAAERESARLSNVDEVTYARMKQKMLDEKYSSPDPNTWGTDRS